MRREELTVAMRIIHTIHDECATSERMEEVEECLALSWILCAEVEQRDEVAWVATHTDRMSRPDAMMWKSVGVEVRLIETSDRNDGSICIRLTPMSQLVICLTLCIVRDVCW